jgi:transposase
MRFVSSPTPTARKKLTCHGFAAKNAKRNPRFNRGLYRERNRIERLINRLKQSRRIATRYEKRAENYLARLTIAAILIWLK